MEKYQNKIGNVVSVSGNHVVIQLAATVKSNIPIIDGKVYRIGQIGSFLKIPLGYTILFGMITNAGAAAVPAGTSGFDQSQDSQWLSMVLIGEQIGNRFERGISQSPTTGDAVHIVTLNDLEFIYGGFSEAEALNIGNISISESINAYLHMNRLISRHFAILGSTGSGKSNAVGIILNAMVAKNFPRTRIMLLDPHGEYSTVFGDNATVFKVNASTDSERLYIPYWALSFAEFANLFDDDNNEQAREMLRLKMIEVKVKSASMIGINIDPLMINADSPIPYALSHLWYDMPGAKLGTASSGDTFLSVGKEGMHKILSNIDAKLRDPRYDFLLKPGEYAPDFRSKISKDLSELLVSWMGGTRPITILDISDIPSDIMMPIAGTMLNIVYEAMFWGQETLVGGREQPVLIALEEAHNYLRAGANSIASRTVQRIAKEGRKYGISLLLVTQRPTELDETVLSQCGTIIALRMNNTKDINFVGAAIQDDLKVIVDMLPSLRIGEGVVSGEGVSIPSKVQFYKLPNAAKSADPEVAEKWAKPLTSNLSDYRNLITLWMNKRFNTESIVKAQAEQMRQMQTGGQTHGAPGGLGPPAYGPGSPGQIRPMPPPPVPIGTGQIPQVGAGLPQMGTAPPPMGQRPHPGGAPMPGQRAVNNRDRGADQYFAQMEE